MPPDKQFNLRAVDPSQEFALAQTYGAKPASRMTNGTTHKSDRDANKKSQGKGA